MLSLYKYTFTAITQPKPSLFCSVSLVVRQNARSPPLRCCSVCRRTAPCASAAVAPLRCKRSAHTATRAHVENLRLFSPMLCRRWSSHNTSADQSSSSTSSADSSSSTTSSSSAPHHHRRRRLRTHYEVLGIEETATHAEIKQAFRKLAKQYHPDRNAQSPRAVFVLISSAYEVLGDEKRRASYDEQLMIARIELEARRAQQPAASSSRPPRASTNHTASAERSTDATNEPPAEHAASRNEYDERMERMRRAAAAAQPRPRPYRPGMSYRQMLLVNQLYAHQRSMPDNRMLPVLLSLLLLLAGGLVCVYLSLLYRGNHDNDIPMQDILLSACARSGSASRAPPVTARDDEAAPKR